MSRIKRESIGREGCSKLHLHLELADLLQLRIPVRRFRGLLGTFAVSRPGSASGRSTVRSISRSSLTATVHRRLDGFQRRDPLTDDCLQLVVQRLCVVGDQLRLVPRAANFDIEALARGQVRMVRLQMGQFHGTFKHLDAIRVSLEMSARGGTCPVKNLFESSDYMSTECG